jgi:ribosomal protein S2
LISVEVLTKKIIKKREKKVIIMDVHDGLMVIPDISNNNMILSEVKKIGIPVIGLVNSHCSFEIDYPIFAQDQTLSSVYFFCHFFATLIAKEMAYTQHKHFILQEKPFHRKKKTKNLTKKKNLSFKQVVIHQKIKNK